MASGSNDIGTSTHLYSASKTQLVPSSSPCGTVQSTVLWAGQNINAGSVSVSNDATNLYVTYSTSGSWMLRKVHLYVGSCNTIPTNNAGNPTVGLFPLSQQFSPFVSNYTFTIPLTSLTDECFCVAAHAELVKIGSTGGVIQAETGWAGNSLIGGNSWARKFKYCVQDCPETCEMNVEIESISPSLCANGSGSVVLSAYGGVAPYSFTIVNTTTGVIYSNQTGIFNGISAGNYLAFVHDINLCQPDCQNTGFSIDLQPSSLYHTVDVLGTCTGSGSTISLNPSGSAGPFLYSIDGTFGSSNQFENVNPGTYNSVVLDAAGCSSSLMVVVSPVASPVLSIQSVQHATCSQQNGSILLSASSGVPDYTFVLKNLFTNQQWNNSSGLFTNLPSGSYAAYVVDANGCKNQHTSSVINVQNLLKNCHQVNVCKVDEQNNLIVYPNPASNKATLYVERELSDNLIITITDQNGKVVFDQTNIDLKEEFELDISRLLPGIYYVDVFDMKSDIHLMTRLVVIPD
jgi:hypothetical protein